MQKRIYMKDEGNLFSNATTLEERPARKPRLIAFIVVFLLLLVAIGFAANYFLGSKEKKQPTVMVTPTLMPSDTPSASGSPSLTPTGSITPTKSTSKTTNTPTPSTTTATSNSNITVQILNGSGVPGAASKVSITLKNLGYTISGTGNANTFDYTNVVIQVKQSEPKILKQLQTDLSKDYTIGSESASLSDSNSSDAIVIVGK